MYVVFTYMLGLCAARWHIWIASPMAFTGWAGCTAHAWQIQVHAHLLVRSNFYNLLVVLLFDGTSYATVFSQYEYASPGLSSRTLCGLPVT